MGEAIADIAKLALLDILFDWVQFLLFGNLKVLVQQQWLQEWNGRVMMTYLHFGISPAWNLHNHVKNGLLLIGVQGDVMKGRQWDTILFNVDAMLQCVGGPILSDRVPGGGIGMVALVADGE